MYLVLRCVCPPMSISASKYRSSLTLKIPASLIPPDYRVIFDFYSPPKQSKFYNVTWEVMLSQAVLQAIPHYFLCYSIRLRVWSSTALSKLLLSDDGGKLSPFPLPASVALHDVFALGKKKATHSVHDISGSGTFQVNTVVCIPLAYALL